MLFKNFSKHFISTLYDFLRHACKLCNLYTVALICCTLNNLTQEDKLVSPLFSDNVGGRLHSIEYKDFCTEYPSIKMTLKRSGGIYHDRFIVLDYGTDDERIFLCGASSKDAGARVTSIVEDFGIMNSFSRAFRAACFKDVSSG